MVKKKAGLASDETGGNYLQHIAYDSVVFGFSEGQLTILIMEYHNTGLFALPGGFVATDENLDDAVQRGLRERTGLENLYLEQFYTFGNLARHRPDVMKKILKANGHNPSSKHWLLDRFVSVGYYALINYKNVIPKPDALSDSCTWYDINKLPALMLDHEVIVKKALDVLRLNLDRKIVGINLLPQRFTMKELQQVYEAIMGTTLSRTNFQRKMLSLGILKRHDKQFSGKAHKAPFVYSFKK